MPPRPPKPPVPDDLDLTALPSFFLNVVKLHASEFFARSTGEEFKAAVSLWCRAWHQVPAASLPDDDEALAGFAGYARDPDGWAKVREMALHGFVKCSDGRLYHLTLAADALRAANSREEFEQEMASGRERARKSRARRRASPYFNDDHVTKTFANVRETKRTVRDIQDKDNTRDERGEGFPPSPALKVFDRADCDNVSTAVLAWNSLAVATGLASVHRVTASRRKKLLARLADAGGLEGWKEALRRIEKSPFLLGRNGRGWCVNFDFVIREASFTKLIEGAYDASAGGTGKGDVMDALDDIARRAG